MKTTTLARLTAFLTLLPVVAHAHPGHDGHELVWEFQAHHIHLEPVIWAALLVLLVVGVFRVVKKQR